MQTPEKLLYAGYGTNRDPQMMEAIIGNTPKSLGTVAINDVELCVQLLDQIPSEIVETAPEPVSPRQIMSGVWGEHSDFESYTIRQRVGLKVSAVLFELTSLERALVAEWELIEFGWYDRMDVTVEFEDGTQLQAETEGLRAGQAIDRVVDGQQYETFLINPAVMFKRAKKARFYNLERLSNR